MKHNTSELTGALLDAAVAKAEGKPFGLMSFDRDISQGITVQHPETGLEVFYSPSTEWAHGGPIIERERIELLRSGGEWCAQAGSSVGAVGDGETPLIAAMRAYVAHKLGDEVEL